MLESPLPDSNRRPLPYHGRLPGPGTDESPANDVPQGVPDDPDEAPRVRTEFARLAAFLTTGRHTRKLRRAYRALDRAELNLLFARTRVDALERRHPRADDDELGPPSEIASVEEWGPCG